MRSCPPPSSRGAPRPPTGAGGSRPVGSQSQGSPPFAESWPDDLDALASLGITAIQLTFEWARLEPRPGHYDEAAHELRAEIAAGARARGLEVWACLVDGTLPGWFADDEGGFGDDRSRSLLWPRHVDRIGERFGHLVDGWVPQRDGIGWALARHLLGSAPPGDSDPRRAAEAVRASLLADGEAWRLLQGTSPVAWSLGARAIRSRPDEVGARSWATWTEHMLWRSWLRALLDGRLDVAGLPERDADHLRGAFDRLIVELRPAIEVDGSGRWHPHPGDRPPGPSGWVAWPDAMVEALRRVADEAGDHPIVAAGSLADVTDDGRARPDHLRAVLDGVTDVAAETDIAGWWQASPIDGYHWQHGHRLRPGLLDADRAERLAAATFRAHPGPDPGVRGYT